MALPKVLQSSERDVLLVSALIATVVSLSFTDFATRQRPDVCTPSKHPTSSTTLWERSSSLCSFAMAPANQVSPAIVPISSGLSLGAGTTLYWLMQPVWPCEP